MRPWHKTYTRISAVNDEKQNEVTGVFNYFLKLELDKGFWNCSVSES